jgi:acetylornithine deacetylase/succinyl-diaminopimelate desuccinylase-like protein
VLCFVGHADVAPTGDLAVWKDQYVVHPFPAPYR